MTGEVVDRLHGFDAMLEQPQNPCVFGDSWTTLNSESESGGFSAADSIEGCKAVCGSLIWLRSIAGLSPDQDVMCGA